MVGSRGHRELKGMLLGSVSEFCVTHANCPVVVVHEGDGQRSGWNWVATTRIDALTAQKRSCGPLGPCASVEAVGSGRPLCQQPVALVGGVARDQAV